MIKPNWDIFKSKFSDNPQDNFEWMCYLLFCKEFDKPFGIFRYKNQAAVETNPIAVGVDVIGWQAKFYDTTLNSNSSKLIKAMKDAKKNHPEITKFYIYSNRDWGQGRSGGKPQGLINIEKKAKELNLEIIWKLESFFQSSFVCVENELLSKHFFSHEKSIFNLIDEQEIHNQSILAPIQTGINFNDKSIEIDRASEVKQILDSKQQVFLISGKGGVGKTVVAKKLYEEVYQEAPYYIFKASEFNNLRTINDFFKDFSFNAFITAHKDDENKFIIIDSAEKILDLNNTDPFKEFIYEIIKENWKVVFTTRENYLDDLNYQLIGTHGVQPVMLNIPKLNSGCLIDLATKYNFKLPDDLKLFELLAIPFYLDKYLENYTDTKGVDYVSFKDQLWNQSIKSGKPAREICFMKIAHLRATEGLFYVIPECESKILDEELCKDGILGYEAPGYFIAHDIYEEWALEKFVENEFIKRTNIADFFNKLGSTLPIRRSFRSWLSEKLLFNDSRIHTFIDESVFFDDIADFWKDEVITSVLLSDYSGVFFQNHKRRLLENDQELFRKFGLLLRVSCKEVDNDLFVEVGLKKIDFMSFKFVFTKPKGNGWKTFIDFLYTNIDSIGFDKVAAYLPVIHEWNSKFREGETTKNASLIALAYYQWSLKQDRFYFRDSIKEKLFQTILNGAAEINSELSDIVDEIVSNKWIAHRDPYHDLIEISLKSLDGYMLAKAIPEKLPKLMTLFWQLPEDMNKTSYYARHDVDEHYGLRTTHDYYPASAYQTPIYAFLKSNLKCAVNFILEFTNNAVEKYAKSGFDKSVKEIDVYIGEDKTNKQYISNCLWCMYRGTGSPVVPNLLTSIHMALEKIFLEHGKYAGTEVLESWLLYLFKNTKSASITSVVSSITRAFPEKCLNVAMLLFRTKEFFRYDTERWVHDRTASTLYSIGYGLSHRTKIFDDERLETCKDKHREFTLENLCLSYQVFKIEPETESDVKARQKAIWEILDYHYDKLKSNSGDTEEDKTWRMFLARMDYRKMNVNPKEVEEGIVLEFEPELTKELKEFQDEAKVDHSEVTKYTELMLWADHKFNINEKSKDYPKYENSHLNVLAEIRTIVSDIQKIEENGGEKEEFEYLLSEYRLKSIVACASAVLLRDNFDDLSDEDACLCKDIVLERAASFLYPDYQYQIGDGLQQAFLTLPIIFEKFESERATVKLFVLFGLFNDYPISMGVSDYFSDFAISALHSLWSISFDDADSILIGYLLHRPRYSEMVKGIRADFYSKGQYDFEDIIAYSKYAHENQAAIEEIANNQLNLSDLGDIAEIDLFYLCTALKLIPINNRSGDHYAMSGAILSIYAKELFNSKSDEKIEYSNRIRFLDAYAFFILNTPIDLVREYLSPFVNEFKSSEAIADFFNRFVYFEDLLNTYDIFWLVWETFRETIINLSAKGDGYGYIDNIVKSYLFAGIPWKENAKDWRSFKNENKHFFDEISIKLGHCPSALYAIAKLLNDIGSTFIGDGIYWISGMVKNNPELVDKELEVNTIYHLESVARTFIYENREEIKKSREMKNAVVNILDFLVKKESVVGYILRETVL